MAFSHQTSSPVSGAACPQSQSHSKTHGAASLFSYSRSFWASSDSEPVSKSSPAENPASALGLDIEAESGSSKDPKWDEDGSLVSSSPGSKIEGSDPSRSTPASPKRPFPSKEPLAPSTPVSPESSPATSSTSSPSSSQFSAFQTTSKSPATSIGFSPQAGEGSSFSGKSRPKHPRSQLRSSLPNSDPPLGTQSNNRRQSGGFRSLRHLASSAASAVSWSPRLGSAGISAPPPTSEDDYGSEEEELGVEDLTETEEGRWSGGKKASRNSASRHSRKPASATGRSPVKLSRKRLDKAVTLALEALQVLEEEEIAREKAKLRRREKANFQELKRQREKVLREGLEKIRNERKLKGLGIDLDEELNSHLANLSSDSEGLEDEEESEVEENDPNLALDLYISSLSHLLCALPASSSSGPSNNPSNSKARRSSPTSRALSLFSSSSSNIPESSNSRRRTTSEPTTAASIPERQRSELKLLLEEALKKLDYDRDQASNPLEVEVGSTFSIEDGRSVIHHHHHYMPYEVNQVTLNNQNQSSRVHPAITPSSPGRQRTISGLLASTAFDLTLTLGASALAAANQGIRSLTPELGSGARSPSTKIIELEPQEADSLSSQKEEATQHYPFTPIPRSHNVDLALTLAGGAASALLSGLSSSAREIAKTHELNSSTTSSTLDLSNKSNHSSTLESSVSQVSTEGADQVEAILVDLARSLKRSPLPSHLSQFMSSSFHLMKAVDKRYSLSDNAFNLTAQKTKSTYQYIDQNQLHIKALKTGWKGVKIASNVWEAYRQEPGWNEGLEVKKV